MMTIRSDKMFSSFFRKNLKRFSIKFIETVNQIGIMRGYSQKAGLHSATLNSSLTFLSNYCFWLPLVVQL